MNSPVRTPKRKRIGGVPLAMSSVYHLLTNPFYAGILLWDGQVFAGKHEPVITPEEFSRVRELLRRSAPRRPQRHEFAFTGLIRCGSCGLGITAEHKVNRFGSHYTYYHCSKRALGPRCREPCVELHDLESQIEAFLRKLAIPPSIERWVFGELQEASRNDQDIVQARRASLTRTIQETEDQHEELTGLRLRGLMDDDEFIRRRTKLQIERMRLQEKLSVDSGRDEWFEPFHEVISFSNRAADWFVAGDAGVKRSIFEIACSNPSLSDKILSIETAKPFSIPLQSANRPSQLGVLEEVRTRMTCEGIDRIIANIRMLTARLDPESVAKKVRRRARGVRGF